MQTSGMCPAFSDGVGKTIVKPAPAPKKPMTAEAPRPNTHRRGGQAAKGKK